MQLLMIMTQIWICISPNFHLSPHKKLTSQTIRTSSAASRRPLHTHPQNQPVQPPLKPTFSDCQVRWLPEELSHKKASGSDGISLRTFKRIFLFSCVVSCTSIYVWCKKKYRCHGEQSVQHQYPTRITHLISKTSHLWS